MITTRIVKPSSSGAAGRHHIFVTVTRSTAMSRSAAARRRPSRCRRSRSRRSRSPSRRRHDRTARRHGGGAEARLGGGDGAGGAALVVAGAPVPASSRESTWSDRHGMPSRRVVLRLLPLAEPRRRRVLRRRAVPTAQTHGALSSSRPTRRAASGARPRPSGARSNPRPRRPRYIRRLRRATRSRRSRPYTCRPPCGTCPGTPLAHPVASSAPSSSSWTRSYPHAPKSSVMAE